MVDVEGATTEVRPMRRIPYETVEAPDRVPGHSLVPVRGPAGELLPGYRGVQRSDTGAVLAVVSSRYGLVGHREVARAVHRVAEGLETTASAHDLALPRERIRLYAGGRRMEHRLVVGQRFDLDGGESFYPGVRVLNSLDGSWAVRLSGFALRLACQNQLYAATGNVVEWRELHLASEGDLLCQLDLAIRGFLEHFRGSLDLYESAMHRELLSEDVEPLLVREGLPPTHAEIIGARAEAEASHTGILSCWTAYQISTAYLTREVQVNPDRERQFERAAARALLVSACSK